MSEPLPIPELLVALRRRALRVFAGAALLTGLGAILDLQQFFESYLVGFLFWIAFPLGALAIVQVHHMTGGSWGFPVRRVLEGAARTLPLLALLFVPLAFGIDRLYGWADAEQVAHDPILQGKSAYLNAPFFLGRAALYFALWIGAMWIQDRLSARRDRDPDRRLLHRQRTLAAPVAAIYVLSMTFAAIDWSMSLEPHWFSSIYGLVFVIGQGLTAFALSIVCASLLARRAPFARWISAEQFHDLGKLMFAFVLLWAYVSYSQFLLIWSGNLLEEIPWYLARSQGGWQWVALALIGLHFALPFLILLSRGVKRDPRKLVVIAGMLIGMRWLDVAWNVVPAFHPRSFSLHWMDFTTTLALGGLWLAAFTRQLERRPLVSLQDADLAGQLERPPSPASGGLST